MSRSRALSLALGLAVAACGASEPPRPAGAEQGGEAATPLLRIDGPADGPVGGTAAGPRPGNAPALPEPPPPLPGEFALRTRRGFYVTAIDGGGRIAEPVLVTASTTAGPWEKFRFPVTYPNTSYDKSLQTSLGNFVTALGGGGLTGGAFHTDATQARDWERFRFHDLSSDGSAPSYYALSTIKGFFVTAVGAGGKYQDAFHTDARQVQAWEQFRIVKCGDVGSGFEYGLLAADGEFLHATPAGGGSQGYVTLTSWPGPETRFRLIRQADGTHALQTSTGVNFVTALGGGGQVQVYEKCDPGFPGACIDGVSTIFHTDATRVRAWEEFRLVDQGDCTYAIQTTSGFFMGIYQDSGGHTLLTTRRDGASTPNEKFQLVVYGLESPAILQ